jgi:predicted deacylase
MLTLPTSYEDSRDRFRKNLLTLKKYYPATQTEFRLIPHPEDDDLTTDILHADATGRKEKIFILSTALHGIEGYVGSVMMQLFIEEYLPKLDPATTGILLVHAINPYGMKHRQRVNPNNVDLNRNFNTDTSKLAEINPAYKKLSPLLNPKRPFGNPLLENIGFFGKVLWNLLLNSVADIREGTLMGQYHTPKGVYHGGAKVQAETKNMMDLLRKHISGYTQIVHLDMHTGYGPRYGMTLVNSPLESMDAQATASKFGYERVAATNPEEFYTIHGDMLDFAYGLVKSDQKIYAGAFEFGTYGDSLTNAIHSLRTSIYENQVRHYGSSEKAKAWVRHEFDELFMPEEKAWLEKAIEDARKAFTDILKAENFLTKI